MNKRPGHVRVTTEPGYCTFCDRTRNLRREERQLGTFVRTVVTCETCHRTLSSTMGVAGAQATATEPAREQDNADVAAVAETTSASEPQPPKRASTTNIRPEAPKSKATKARVIKTK
jgi:hypothetical protein